MLSQTKGGAGMKRNEEEQGAALLRYAREILLGGGAALLCCILLLLFASVGIAGGMLGEELMPQITIAAGVVGSFVGAVAAIRRCGVRALVVGLSTGAVFFLLLLTIGLVLYGMPALEEGAVGLLCASLCGGGAAGFLAGRRGNKKRRGGQTARRRAR